MRQPTTERLPAPEPEAAALSEALVAEIAQALDAAGGWLGFDRYMERALYAPGLGYYSAGLAKFGAAGDFVTAPELGGLFARTLARQIASILDALGGGEILEFGAGSGALAAALLGELTRRDALPERYAILELSADLRARQHAAIAAAVPPAVLERVVWLERWPEASVRGVVLANEVLDAMPVRAFSLAGGQVWEDGVALGEAGLGWSRREADASFAARVLDRLSGPIADYPEGYRGELNERLLPWFEGLAGALAQGVALLVDYGGVADEVYRTTRAGGTLRAYYRHRLLEEPFWWPGLCDLTADVDFSAVASAAEAAGLRVAGFAPQSQMLLTGGLEGVFAEAFAAAPDELARVRLTQEVKRLTLPGEMGERFWALALSRDYAGILPGFAARDFRYRLSGD
ncbi:hypothetical protein BJI67_02805 [Acidihalobacter aeolianus]|uniref:SAM-dependent methyltransferase n=1 Tax=Acidihalobacter aeolianus TaxID=2792603 RepID=A0A1D8K598_9GAMM|nr:SAM-dependent methyltransferase [Acidihalobacter aeolianus]AOV16137.1 hypothetical protein BJI67_02805 [Acidihalobacter aeolianus]